MIISLVTLSVIIVKSATLNEEEKQEINESVRKFLNSTTRLTLFFIGAVVELIAIVINIFGVIKEHFWFILVCVILEIFAIILNMIAVLPIFLLSILVTILSITWLFIMFKLGLHKGTPFS